MRKAEVACALALLGVAGVATAEGLRLGVGWGTDGPQSGFFVFYLGLGLVGAAVSVLGQAGLRPDLPLYRRRFLEAGQVAPVAKVLVPAIAMVFLTQFVGVYVAAGLYLGGYMRRIGRHSWTLTVALSVAIPVATFVIFEVWFLVPLPKGPLEAYLGY